jgi:hypothetical protein
MAAFSISEPFPTFHGANGAPLQDGFIYIGTANQDPQTNPVQLYWDSALTIAAVQPLRTINGYVSQYGTPAQVYVNADDFSIRVCDKNNVPVYSAASAQHSWPFSQITGQLDSSRVNYAQGNALAVARTVQAKLQESVSVFDFMTTDQIADVQAGTLTYDVTTPIQTAINNAQDVYFPAGEYKITAPLTISFSVGKTLRGAGCGKSIIHNMGTGSGIVSTGNGFIGNWNIYIADLAVRGQAGTQNGIILTYTYRSAIERVEVSYNGIDGVKLQNCTTVNLTGLYSHNNTGSGLAFGLATASCNVFGGTLSNNTLDGAIISAESSTIPVDIAFFGTRFAYNSTYNLELIDAKRCGFSNCNLITSSSFTTQYHAYVRGTLGSSEDNTFDSCTFSGTNGTGSAFALYLGQANNTSFSGCYIDIQSSITAAATNTKFTNSTLTVSPTDASVSTYFTPTRQYATVAQLPPYGTAGRIAFVFDGTSALAWGVTVTGGGSTPYLVLDNGLGWKVLGK